MKLNEYLKKSLEERSKLLKKLNGEVNKYPEGGLCIRIKKGKYPQYYLDYDGKTTYLRKNKMPLIKQLAQKSYCQAVHKQLKNDISELERFINNYNENEIYDIFENLSHYRKELVIPSIESDEMFIERWMKECTGNRNSYPFQNPYETDRGEIVRSKSEKIYADYFYHEGIPYVYEPEILCANGKKMYPDFALLNVRQRKTVLFEHFGMMDDEQYCNSALEKIKQYQMNGYWYGENFIFAFESHDNPINIKIVEKMLQHYVGV